MVQKRIQDYGTLAEASDIKKVIYGLARSTVVQGFRFSVGSVSKLSVSPGIAVTNQGVMIIEDEVQTIEVQASSAPQDYTLVYYHTDEDISGGVSAELQLSLGLLNPADINGVILGYIRYPGSAVPLSTGYFLQEPELILRNYIPNRLNNKWIIPMNGYGYFKSAHTGSVLTVSDVYDSEGFYLRIQNNVNDSAVGNAVFTFPFKVDEHAFSLMQVKMQIDLGSSVEFQLVDSSGDTVSITSTSLASSASLNLYSLTIPKDAVQIPNTLVYLNMILNISATNQVKVQGLGLSPYNLPI